MHYLLNSETETIVNNLKLLRTITVPKPTGDSNWHSNVPYSGMADLVCGVFFSCSGGEVAS